MQPVMPEDDVGARLAAAEHAGAREHPLLGLLAHGAGVDQDQVGARRDRRCARSRRAASRPSTMSLSATFIWQP